LKVLEQNAFKRKAVIPFADSTLQKVSMVLADFKWGRFVSESSHYAIYIRK
jgi:hypothetical protein